MHKSHFLLFDLPDENIEVKNIEKIDIRRSPGNSEPEHKHLKKLENLTDQIFSVQCLQTLSSLTAVGLLFYVVQLLQQLTEGWAAQWRLNNEEERQEGRQKK